MGAVGRPGTPTLPLSREGALARPAWTGLALGVGRPRPDPPRPIPDSVTWGC